MLLGGCYAWTTDGHWSLQCIGRCAAANVRWTVTSATGLWLPGIGVECLWRALSTLATRAAETHRVACGRYQDTLIVCGKQSHYTTMPRRLVVARCVDPWTTVRRLCGDAVVYVDTGAYGAVSLPEPPQPTPEPDAQSSSLCFMHLFDLQDRGGRITQPIALGLLRRQSSCGNDDGRWHDAVRKNVLDQDGGGVCMFRTLSRGGVRPLDDADVQCGPPSEKLKMLRDAGATEVPHVLPVLGVLRNDAPRTQSELTVFHPWCAGGSLCGPASLGWLTDAELAGVLLGAWRGLYWLNCQARLLHYDIKPGNIFIRRSADNDGWEGVLGDVDDVVSWDTIQYRHTKNARRRMSTSSVAVQSTFGYGSPFRAGDPRRDQTALLITTIETLAGCPWFQWCVGYLKPQSQDRNQYWGYATGQSGFASDWRYWVSGVYRAYGQQDTVRERVCPELLGWLVRLDDTPMDELDQLWVYDRVHSEVCSALRRTINTVDATQHRGKQGMQPQQSIQAKRRRSR